MQRSPAPAQERKRKKVKEKRNNSKQKKEKEIALPNNMTKKLLFFVCLLLCALAFAAAGETKLLNQLVAEGRPRKKGRRRNNGKRNKGKRNKSKVVYVNGCWRVKTLSGGVPQPCIGGRHRRFF